MFTRAAIWGFLEVMSVVLMILALELMWESLKKSWLSEVARCSTAGAVAKFIDENERPVRAPPPEDSERNSRNMVCTRIIAL